MVPQPKVTTEIAVNDSRGPVMTADGGEPAFISQSTLGYLTLGLGGAGLAVGGITGLMAFQRHSDLVDLCQTPDVSPCHIFDPDGSKRTGALKKQHDMKTYATASTIGFIAGGALAATGLILLITAPDDPEEQAQAATLRPYFGLGTIGAVGSF
jgi:hypothetical protein